MSQAPHQEHRDPTGTEPAKDPPAKDRPAPPRHPRDAETLVATGATALPSSQLPIALAHTLPAEAPAGEPGAAEPAWDAARLPVVDPSSYRVTGEVGQGGIGRVWRAADTRLARPVALKELLAESSQAAEERFVREALLTARLQHPSIVPLYEAGRWPTGELFYTMKLVSGRSLADILLASETLDARLGLLPHVLAVAEAMAYAHSEKIIHRDLKPANVLVGEFGETVVIDWGLAKDLSVAGADVELAEAAAAETRPEGGQSNAAGAGPEITAPAPRQSRTEAGTSQSGPNAAGQAPPGQSPPDRAPSNHTPSNRTPSNRTPSNRAPSNRAPSNRTPRARTPSGRTPPGEALTVHGAVMGTPAYMPPEQARGEAVDERADVYALGAILYHLLSGKCPYDGDSRAVLKKVLAGPPVPLAERQAGIPEDLLAIVRKAMTRDPGGRYPTAKELADDLRRFQTGQIVAAHRYSRGELARRFVRRYRGALSVAAAALVLLGALGVYSVHRIMAESRLARDKQALAEAAESRAEQRADDVTLAEARDAAGEDPNQALAWLKTLSPRFERWSEARLYAADARAHGVSVVLRGHTAAINQVAFSRDGKWLASASDDHTIRVWDLSAEDGGPRAARLFPGHTDEAWSLAVSPDGATLASGGKDGSVRTWDVRSGDSRVFPERHAQGIPELFFAGADLLVSSADDGATRLWDVKTGEPRAVLAPLGQSRTLAVSANGRTAATGGNDHHVHVWDLPSGAARSFPAEGATLWGIAVSPDGKLVASRDRDGAVRLWDAETGASKQLSPPLAPGLVKLTPYDTVRFSADGKLLATAAEGPFLRVWDVATGAERRLAGPEGDTVRVEFSLDGSLVAAASQDHAAHVWDLASGEHRALRGFGDQVLTVAISADGKIVAAGSADGTIRLYQVASAAARSFGDGRGPLLAGDISPDRSHVLAAGEDGKVRVWSVATGQATSLEGHEGPVVRAVFSPDGQLVASAGKDGTVRIWDLEGHEIWAFGGRAPGSTSLQFSPDGRLVAAPGLDGAVLVLDVDAGTARALRGKPGEVTAAVFSPDGAEIAAPRTDGAIEVWSLEKGEARTLAGHTLAALSAAFSPDGKTLATGATDHTIRLWDLATGDHRKIDSGGGGASQIVFSADGRTLFTRDYYETRVRLWDVATGRAYPSLTGHQDFVNRFSLSPDGRRLVTASGDRTVRLWDLASGESRVLEKRAGAVTDVAFSRDGKLVFSVSADGTARLEADDLPEDPAALRAWIDSATPDTIGVRERPE
jgi:WD40 repeat protein/serine/threonine protein kinase